MLRKLLIWYITLYILLNFHFWTFRLDFHLRSNDLDSFHNMSSRLPKNIKKSASKRNRSQDSQRSLTPAPINQVSKKIEAHKKNRVPAFLRQSKAGKLLMFWKIPFQPALAQASQTFMPNFRSWSGYNSFGLPRDAMILLPNGRKKQLFRFD